MRILFSTFGSLGDLHPYIAVASEAKARGHQPILATAAKYRAKIESLGLEFRPVRPDLPAEADFGPLAKRVMDLKDGPRFLFQDVLSPALRDSYADLLAASEDADVIITHPAALAGPLVAQKLGKKWLSSVLAPISLWSKFDPPVPPTLPQLDFLRALGPIWPTIMFTLGRRGTAPWVEEVEKLRREIGIPSLGHPMFEGQFSPFGTLALFSRHFATPQRDWPVNTTATGFCFYDAQGYENQKTEAWREWIEEGEPPIVFTLGSSAVFAAGDFYRLSASIALDYDRRGLLLVGKETQNDPQEQMPPEILSVDYAPHGEVFSRACLIVHQGGAGTTAQALRAGVPQIIVPFAHDQPDNAARLQRLGVGYSEKRRHYPGQAFELFFDSPAFLTRNARHLGEKIRAENGPRAACEAIERLLT
ncbi:MAG: glycosyltransferase [Armatimonadetes bacterium]|nr:glycosyltransferase [Armatimonadota bacterium]